MFVADSVHFIDYNLESDATKTENLLYRKITDILTAKVNAHKAQ